MTHKKTIYIPRALRKANLPPVFDRRDIIYIRYRDAKTDKIIRVARLDPMKGIVQALYPTHDSTKFLGESFAKIDQESERIPIEKSGLQDKIWTALLEGTDAKKLLTSYIPQMLGVYPSGSYLFSNSSDSRTFHIIDSEEPNSELELSA